MEEPNVEVSATVSLELVVRWDGGEKTIVTHGPQDGELGEG
jgi:hypothetical protein